MISETLFYLIAILGGLGLVGGATYLLARAGLNMNTAFSLSALVILGGIALWKFSGTCNVYYIEPNGSAYEITEYVNFGSSVNVEIPGKEPEEMIVGPSDCLVVNCTGGPFTAEEHVYGSAFTFGETKITIQPLAAEVISHGSIDYMPGETVPSSVSVSKGSSSAWKWSLREGY